MLPTVITSIVIHLSHSASWSHDNMDYWEHTWQECGYDSQSPIDITIDGTTSACDTPLVLDWTAGRQHFAIRNNGHSLVAIPFEIDSNGYGDFSGLEVLHHTNDTNIRLQNAFYNTFKSPVNKEYCFDSMHFHWGVDNVHGSEHTINGNEYPLELHLVHYSCDWYLISQALYDYASGEVAERYDDNNILAVIGIIFEIGAPNAVLQQILDDVIIDGVSQFHDPIEKFGDHLLEIFYDEFDLNGLLPDNREMIAYEGSLTTPPCYETVRWHVMKHRMTVSAEQMDQFRLILRGTNSSDTVAPNFRPVQELNNREVFHCQEDVDALSVEKDASSGDNTNNGNNGESNTDDTSSTSASDTWFIVGVTFICLFGVSVLIILYLAHLVNVLSGKKDYIKTKSTDPDHDIEINENGIHENGNAGNKSTNNNYH